MNPCIPGPSGLFPKGPYCLCCLFLHISTFTEWRGAKGRCRCRGRLGRRGRTGTRSGKGSCAGPRKVNRVGPVQKAGERTKGFQEAGKGAIKAC